LWTKAILWASVVAAEREAEFFLAFPEEVAEAAEVLVLALDGLSVDKGGALVGCLEAVSDSPRVESLGSVSKWSDIGFCSMA